MVKLGDERFDVTLGEGHAMVDGVRVEGTCNWLPGMSQAEEQMTGAFGRNQHWLCNADQPSTIDRARPLTVTVALVPSSVNYCTLKNVLKE